MVVINNYLIYFVSFLGVLFFQTEKSYRLCNILRTTRAPKTSFRCWWHFTCVCVCICVCSMYFLRLTLLVLLVLLVFLRLILIVSSNLHSSWKQNMKTKVCRIRNFSSQPMKWIFKTQKLQNTDAIIHVDFVYEILNWPYLLQ